MKAMRLLNLAVALTLLATLTVAAGAQAPASPVSDGCTGIGGYDPACDVNHDNHINITDVQLTAGHWGNSGIYVSDNNHNHLGQSWTAAGSSLVINGVDVGHASDDGIFVSRAGSVASGINRTDLHNGIEIGNTQDHGMRIANAGLDGIAIIEAARDGLHIEHAAGDGVYLCRTGTAGGCTSRDDLNNGIEIAHADHHGLYVSGADWNGVHILDGENDGVHVEWATYMGVYVKEANTGVLASTRNGNGEWGLFTWDKIYGDNVLLGSLTLVAQVNEEQALAAGDLVTAVGVADPLPESTSPLALVSLASSDTAIVGVVEGRMVLTPVPQHEDEQEKKPLMELRSAEGPAQPGDYVALTVLGVAQVKVDASADIQPGQRLTASDVAGNARALRTDTLNGMIVSEGAPVLGTALAALEPGQEMIPVFVTLR